MSGVEFRPGLEDYRAAVVADATEPYARPGWFENLARTTAAGAGAVTVAADDVAIPARMDGGVLRSLSNLYTVENLAPAMDAERAERLARALRAASPRPHQVAWEAMRPKAADAAIAGFRAAGWAVERYVQFGTWREVVEGRSFEDYWAARPGQVRSTVKRKRARLFANPDMRIEDHVAADADRAVEAYERCHDAAWQGEEPFRDFVPGLIRTGLAEGWARVFSIRDGEKPVAAQVWTVGPRRATIFKLAHDPAYGDFSPGTILTAISLERLLPLAHGLREIDFGRGDDPYKKDWAPDRIAMTAFIASDPQTLRGFAQATGFQVRRIGRALKRRVIG